MANLKDLIVNGTSRFIGKIYGKISNAYVADIEGVTVAASSTSYSDGNLTVSNWASASIGSATGAQCDISISTGVTRIIFSCAYYTPLIIKTITAKSGSFVNGQKLMIWGCVKLATTLVPYYGSQGSESGITVVGPSKIIVSSSGGGAFPDTNPQWHEFVYWGGKWYGKAYNVTYATDSFSSNTEMPITASAVTTALNGYLPRAQTITEYTNTTSGSQSSPNYTKYDLTSLTETPKMLKINGAISYSNEYVYLPKLANRIMFVFANHTGGYSSCTFYQSDKTTSIFCVAYNNTQKYAIFWSDSSGIWSYAKMYS